MRIRDVSGVLPCIFETKMTDAEFNRQIRSAGNYNFYSPRHSCFKENTLP